MISPRVSIVVPFYNSEDTLPACLDGLRKQTLEDIEIILVDDGSEDDSLAVARAFAESYEGTCVVLHQENRGPSAARNKGLEVAAGEFVAFVDSDDEVDPTMYEKMIASADKHDSDIVSCGRVAIDKATGEVIKEQIPAYDVLSGSLAQCPDIVKRVGPLMCDKMFRRSIISGYSIRFDEDIWHAEDFLFCSRFKLYVKAVSAVGEALYRYKIGDSTSLSGGNARVMDIPIACERVADLYREKGVLDVVERKLLFVFAGYYLRKGCALLRCPSLLRKYKRKFKKILFAGFRLRWVPIFARRISKGEGGLNRVKACFTVLLR